MQFLDYTVVTGRDKAFDKLEIDQLRKQLIKSIVSSHFRSRDIEKSGTDLCTRGGKEKRFLFSCMASQASETRRLLKPLLRNGGSFFPCHLRESGLTPESVDEPPGLNGIFRPAHLWDFVLLWMKQMCLSVAEHMV